MEAEARALVAALRSDRASSMSPPTKRCLLELEARLAEKDTERVERERGARVDREREERRQAARDANPLGMDPLGAMRRCYSVHTGTL